MLLVAHNRLHATCCTLQGACYLFVHNRLHAHVVNNILHATCCTLQGCMLHVVHYKVHATCCTVYGEFKCIKLPQVLYLTTKLQEAVKKCAH